LRLEKFKQEVARLEAKHSNLKDTKTLFFREQMSITNKFYDSVCVASRKLFSQALRDATNWNNNLMVPMETYVREHHTQLRRRLESVKRIHKASDTVETRLNELLTMQAQLVDQHQQFHGYQNRLVSLLAEAELANQKDPEKDETGAEILYWDKSIHF